MVRIAAQSLRQGAAGVPPVVVIYERPSRTLQALVVVAALLMMAMAGWVLAPIALANLPASVAAIPIVRDVIADRVAPESQSQAAASTSPAPETTAADVAEQSPASPAEAAPTAAAEAAPAEDAGPAWVGSVPTPTPAYAQFDTPVVVPIPTGTTPWPNSGPATPRADDQAVVAEEAAPAAPDEAAPAADTRAVPLPRRRPSAAIMAHMSIPVPRPRPEDAPAQVEENSDMENLLFDRASQPN